MVLPRILQGLLTALTGKPFWGQKPWNMTPTHHIVSATLSMLVGVLCSSFAILRGGTWLLALLPGWMATVHGMRNLRQMIFHQSGHTNLYGRGNLDAMIGRIISTFLVVEGFDRYRHEHVFDHHASRHMTLHDPTVKALLITVGLRPGMSRREQWHMLLRTLVSPSFHSRYLVARFCSHFRFASFHQKAISLTFLAALFSAVTVTHAWVLFLLVWIVPLTMLYQTCSVLRLAAKHVFPTLGGARSGRTHFASLTNAVFLGEAVPTSGTSNRRMAVAWCRWVLRMVFVHFPSRYLVMTGDTVVHDYHHRHPRSSNWANYIFARQDDLMTGHPGWPPYTAVWGLVPAINKVFDSITGCDPDEFAAEKLFAGVAGSRRRRTLLPGDGGLFEAFED